MNLYIPSNYFKLVGNPRWKRSLFESVSVITQFQCSIRSHFRPLSTPPFNRSHRRPRKAWNSLNVSLDWKSNAVSRGRYEHRGVCRSASNIVANSLRSNRATFYIFSRAWTSGCFRSFLLVAPRSRILSSLNFRSKDFEHPIFSTSSSFFFSYLGHFFLRRLIQPRCSCKIQGQSSELTRNNFLHHEDY